MANPQVVNYIRSNLSNGVRLEDIKSSLRQSGWPEADITAGVAEVQGMQEPALSSLPATSGEQQPRMKKKGHKKLIVAVIVLIILVILFLYTAVDIIMTFREMFPGAGDSMPVGIPFIS